jgi:CO/xanthine dehydrogenase Mo-binding subunit
MMGSGSEDIHLQHGQLWDKEHELHLAEVLEEAKRRGIKLQAQHRFVAPPTTGLDENGQGNPFNQYSYGTQVVELELDEITGEVKVQRVDAFYDAGRILNPLGAKKQVEGAVVMGLGYALTEEFIMRNGIPINGNLTNYLIPTIVDAPTKVECTFVGRPIPFGELGARGIAEPALIPTAPAIANAIYNATGARLFRIPATPERVLQAIETSREAIASDNEAENEKA